MHCLTFIRVHSRIDDETLWFEQWINKEPIVWLVTPYRHFDKTFVSECSILLNSSQNTIDTIPELYNDLLHFYAIRTKFVMWYTITTVIIALARLILSLPSHSLKRKVIAIRSIINAMYCSLIVNGTSKVPQTKLLLLFYKFQQYYNTATFIKKK